MNQAIKKRLIRTAVLSVIALGIGAMMGFWQLKMQSATAVNKGDAGVAPMKIAGLQIGGPFTLTNDDGNKVTEKDFEGQYKLIYFGFTYCPAICPTELQKISQVMRSLDDKNPDISEKMQPLFITVDPERDTVDVMNQYVDLFHPKLIGLTGTQPQIDFVKQAYRVFSKKVDDPEQQDYTVDHSSYIYLMGPENTLVSIYRMQDDADYIYDDVIARIDPKAS